MAVHIAKQWNLEWLRARHEIPSVQEAKADEAKGEAKSEALPCRAYLALGGGFGAARFRSFSVLG